VSKVSDISQRYHRSLEQSQGQFEDLYRKRIEAAEGFYEKFFHQLVCNFGDQFQNERFRARMQELIERQLGKNKLNFVAIDGTCQKKTKAEFITFFGGAYGARGEIDFNSGEHKLRYQRWSLDNDVSMVAWVPVPFARLEEITSGEGEQFLVSEEERVDLSSVHVKVMQLAEVFLAYNSVQSSRLESPDVLLMDLSPSSVLASVAQRQDRVGLVGYPYDRRRLTEADITVALAHPFSEHFGIPAAKSMDLHRVLIAALHESPTDSLDLEALAQEHGVSERKLEKQAKRLVRRGILKRPRLGQPNYTPEIRVDNSYAYTREVFQNICERLFIKKDPSALQYAVEEPDGTERQRWMSPDDLGFLIGIGVRLLIEACWDRNVLFYGVVKDSSSRYLTRNFLGTSLEAGFHPDLEDLDIQALPWTDRIFCESLPLIDEELNAPWATIEFDSAFMTLHRERVEGTIRTRVAGVMGDIVNQERLFARSLGQFFLKREKDTPLMGHVVFLERLLSPMWDDPNADSGPDTIDVSNSELGQVAPFAWRDNEHTNLGQRVMMYLLSVLTRNHYAEAIGYPDPLHKADWGAKSVGRSVSAMIDSSHQYLRSRPLSRTFRDIRDSSGR